MDSRRSSRQRGGQAAQTAGSEELTELPAGLEVVVPQASDVHSDLYCGALGPDRAAGSERRHGRDLASQELLGVDLLVGVNLHRNTVE